MYPAIDAFSRWFAVDDFSVFVLLCGPEIRWDIVLFAVHFGIGVWLLCTGASLGSGWNGEVRDELFCGPR